MNIKKLEEIKTALSKILEIEKVEMRSMTDDLGNMLSWEKDIPVPELGDVLYVETRESEEKELAPAGEYFLTNEIGERIKLTVGADGIITEIETIYAEEIPEEVENPVEPEEEMPVEVEAEETPEEEPEMPVEEPAEVEVVEDVTKELEAEIEALKAEIEALKAENDELKARIAELEAEPQAEPVEQQFEAMTKKQQNACGALKYAQALKK